MTTAVVLLPGLLCNAALWRSVTDHLTGTRAVTVADLSRDQTIAAMAARVLDTAPPQFALAGLSMGGYVAFEIMRQAPGRVERLALFDTSPRPETPEGQERRAALIELARTGRFRGVTQRLLPLLIHADRVDDPAISGVVFDMAERIGQDAFIRQQTAILQRADSRPSLRAITCPTLVAVGADDQITPPEIAREMATDIADAELLVIPRCGHLPPLEDPRTTCAAFDRWLMRS